MPVYFKHGKFATKMYEHLCKDRMIYLKTGKYSLDLDKGVLTCLSDSDISPLHIRDYGALQFYYDLDVDFGRDKVIPLTLDRKGLFHRTDDIKAKATIETLFDCGSKIEEK